MPIFHFSGLQAVHLTFVEMKRENWANIPRLQFKLLPLAAIYANHFNKLIKFPRRHRIDALNFTIINCIATADVIK